MSKSGLPTSVIGHLPFISLQDSDELVWSSNTSSFTVTHILHHEKVGSADLDHPSALVSYSSLCELQNLPLRVSVTTDNLETSSLEERLHLLSQWGHADLELFNNCCVTILQALDPTCDQLHTSNCNHISQNPKILVSRRLLWCWCTRHYYYYLLEKASNKRTRITVQTVNE